MFKEKDIDKLIQPLLNRQNQIEMTVIKAISERIADIGEIIPSDVYKLETLYRTGSDVKKINKKIASLTRLQESEIKKIIKTVAADAYDDAKPYYDYRKKQFISFEENKELQKVVAAVERVTLADYNNISNTMAFMLRDVNNPMVIRPTTIAKTYQRIVDIAIQSATLGAETYNTIISKAIKEIIDSGIKTIDNTYKVEYTTEKGKKHYVRLDTAVRRNILDGIRNINQQIQSITGEQFGSDGVEITVHEYSAPDHEPVQGHLFTNEEFDKMQTGKSCMDINGVNFDSFDRPIGLWNCRHFTYSIIIGAMKPKYSISELEKIKQRNKNGYSYTDKNGNKNIKSMYWCTQKQRDCELDIKKAREGLYFAKKAKNEELQQQYAAKLAKARNKYIYFSNSCGLETHMEKTRIFI